MHFVRVGLAAAVVALLSLSATAGGGGVDTTMQPTQIVGLQSDILEHWGDSGVWLRTSALPNPQSSEAAIVEAAALQHLRNLGIRILARVRWNSPSWQSGVRPGGGKRVPLDLREAYDRAKRYSEVYGAVVDAFEFENEPDIAFVEENPETYAAFLKACYLGVQAGRPPRAASETWSQQIGPAIVYAAAVSATPEKPLVAMAPLALPPGPFLEQLRANGLLSYTDVFNYHFYGYAEDFAGVYRQFEDALQSSDLPPKETLQVPARSQDRLENRRLPVFVSEYGYGRLGAHAANTVEGRVRQWQWFKAVNAQVRDLRIEAPMAFQLRHGLERGILEFGLTVPSVEATVSSVAYPRAPLAPMMAFSSGALEFNSSDFGATATEPWMKRIGTKVGESEATPALAWLMEVGTRDRYRPRAWKVASPRRSNVVVDFIAGSELLQIKRYNGYIAENAPNEGRCHARAQIVVYNFSARPVSGLLQAGGAEVEIQPNAGIRVELAPFERRLVPIELGIHALGFGRKTFSAEFIEDGKGKPPSRFATAFFPSTQHMQESVISRFQRRDSTTASTRILVERSLATEEPKLSPQGRWMTTSGVLVEEVPNGWRFTVAPDPDGARERKAAELPLPTDFDFPPDAVLALKYRLAEPAGTDLKSGRNLQIYLRTQNGNLYVVWPWARAIDRWSDYVELQSNFTMMFHGRAELPWRFSANRAVALVFAFGAEKIPLVFEIADPRISLLRAKNG